MLVYGKDMSPQHKKKLLDLHQKAKELSDSLYPTIGEFAVAFEAICHAIRMGIDDILQKNGLRNSRITDILIGDLTAHPLQDIYRALLLETEKLDKTEVAILDNIFKRVSQVGEHRNRIIHSAWFIDFKNAEDIMKGLLLRYKPGRTKKGAKESPSKIPIQEIKAIIKEARVLGDLIHQLNMCLYCRSKIGPRFSFDADGNVIATGSIMDFFSKKK